MTGEINWEEYPGELIRRQEAFLMEDDREKKRVLRELVFEYLQALGALNSDDLHVLGMTWYWSRDLDEDYLIQAQRYFSKAYAMDHSNFLACLYVAHCYHDQNDWENALMYYQKVDQTALNRFMDWRGAKLFEQIGMCYHMLGEKEKGRGFFRRALEAYKEIEPDYRPSPTEMGHCLSEEDPLMAEVRQVTGEPGPNFIPD